MLSTAAEVYTFATHACSATARGRIPPRGSQRHFSGRWWHRLWLIVILGAEKWKPRPNNSFEPIRRRNERSIRRRQRYRSSWRWAKFVPPDRLDIRDTLAAPNAAALDESAHRIDLLSRLGTDCMARGVDAAHSIWRTEDARASTRHGPYRRARGT